MEPFERVVFKLYNTWSAIRGIDKNQTDFSNSDEEFLQMKKEYQDYKAKKAAGTLTEDDKKSWTN